MELFFYKLIIFPGYIGKTIANRVHKLTLRYITSFFNPLKPLVFCCCFPFSLCLSSININRYCLLLNNQNKYYSEFISLFIYKLSEIWSVKHFMGILWNIKLNFALFLFTPFGIWNKYVIYNIYWVCWTALLGSHLVMKLFVLNILL